MEMRNVGSFDTPLRVKDELPAEIQIPKMIQACNDNGVFMKEHNADYLSDEALYWHPRLGIHAANIAPEFGVAESKALVNCLEENGLNNLADEFLDEFGGSKVKALATLNSLENKKLIYSKPRNFEGKGLVSIFYPNKNLFFLIHNIKRRPLSNWK